MARTRSIKPGFFENEILSALPYQDRLAFIGLWTIADRDGRLEDRPLRIHGQIFPYDHEIDIEGSLLRLTSAGFIIRYEVDGKKYICIPTWAKHQRPHVKEQASVIPEHQPRKVQNHNLGSGDAAPSTLPPVIPSTLPPENGLTQRARENGTSALVTRYQDFLAQFPYPTGADEGCRQWISMIHVGEISESNVDQIFQGLARWKASRQWANGKRQTIPNWLRDKRWRDNPEPQAKDALDD